LLPQSISLVQRCRNKSFIGQGANHAAHQSVIAEAQGVLARPFLDGLQHFSFHQFFDLIGALGGRHTGMAIFFCNGGS